MKILITMTLDVDREAWATEYGLPLTEVRQDVRNYIIAGVQADLEARGLLQS